MWVLHKIIQNTTLHQAMVASRLDKPWQAILRFVEAFVTLRVMATQCARNGGKTMLGETHTMARVDNIYITKPFVSHKSSIEA